MAVKGMRANYFLGGYLLVTIFFPSASRAEAQESVTLHGFISASGFWQDQDFFFGNGQNAEFPAPAAAGRSNELSGSDVRNTRLWIEVAVPDAGIWRVSGHLEGDLFGGFNGTGAFSAEQESARLRMAYFDLDDGDIRWRIGQQWNLLFPFDNVPESCTHVAFPPALAVGLIGWRFPGVVWSETLAVQGDENWRLDLGAFEGSWNGPGNAVNAGTAGNAGFHPQLEARLHVEEREFLWYLTAHYSREELAGVGGTAPIPLGSSVSTHAWETGLRWQLGHWVLHAGAYTGRGLGADFGALVQFGDIAEWGGYAQLGYKFLDGWALYGSYSRVLPNQKDVLRWVPPSTTVPALLASQQATVELMYTDGPWGWGLEWLRALTRYTSDPSGTVTAETGGQQLSVSGIFRF